MQYVPTMAVWYISLLDIVGVDSTQSIVSIAAGNIQLNQFDLIVRANGSSIIQQLSI